VRPEPVRDMRRDDQQALEEIRRLFARYRQIARHGQATAGGTGKTRTHVLP